jgi:hypothetical protein
MKTENIVRHIPTSSSGGRWVGGYVYQNSLCGVTEATLLVMGAGYLGTFYKSSQLKKCFCTLRKHDRSRICMVKNEGEQARRFK